MLTDDSQKDLKAERDLAIRLESHSRRNNLNFCSIPEEVDESLEQTESILRNFMDKELRVEDMKKISNERAHRIRKPRSGGKPQHRTTYLTQNNIFKHNLSIYPFSLISYIVLLNLLL